MITMIRFEEVKEFEKDKKKMLRKYGSLDNDIETFKLALSANLKEIPPRHLSGTVKISRLGQGVTVPIYKVRHFNCKSLKNKGAKSGIRITYAYESKKKKVTLIEIYRHNKKTKEDRKRILKYFLEKK